MSTPLVIFIVATIGYVACLVLWCVSMESSTIELESTCVFELPVESANVV